ncbi:NAD(P)/FAD-dependent oxidoreductase [Pseudooceanicola algae]|uniref:Gamma-glutamylputrescine oxidoreductase n=1 Tax=Pseudooceanicola algae TaxID=1537215 RepID=A0A418SJ74_9RHOB|nr:FAD-binding oxidoreductase [Pseudooceanicola algae]QPM90153.1 Gamma-glutamylputrescine oxidoreductase [Pseudooceanicola algae]
MKLLYSNDAPRSYPQSWYAATAQPLAPFPALDTPIRADLCVIGGGFTGLSAALHAAEAGLTVALLDAQRVGFGASGRNGGQLGSGQRPYQDDLEKWLGPDEARALWFLAEDAKTLVQDLCARHDIDCDLKPGVAWIGCSTSDSDHLHHYADHLHDRYGYDQIEPLSPEACARICPSPAYHGGILDHGAAHLHPLKLALGLARAARDAGVAIYEGTEAMSLTPGSPAVVKTPKGQVTADHVILAGNGYLTGLHREPARRVMPINNFIAVTEPLGDAAAQVLTRDIAVADSKFVVNYFRLTPDMRLLFGGGESYGYTFPVDIAAKVRKPMAQIFPHLAKTRIDYAWGGTLGITMKRAPFLSRLGPNILTAGGYSGHGVGTATHAGQLMALALTGQAAGFDTMARMPAPPFPGGPALRTPLLTLAMTWFSLRDRLGI